MTHCTKETIYQKDSTFLKSNHRGSKYIWQNLTELHEGINKFANIVENFKTALLITSRQSRQKVYQLHRF